MYKLGVCVAWVAGVLFACSAPPGDEDGGSTAGGSTAGGSTAGGSTAGGSTAGGSTAGGSTAGGSTAGGSTAGGSTAGGSTAGGSTAGGAAGGGFVPGDGGTAWLNGHLANLMVGQWLDVSTSTNVGPIVDQSGPSPAAWLESEANKPMNNWPGKMTYDDANKSIILTGTAEGYISEVPSGAHSAALFFSLNTGQFSKTWNPVGASLGHVYDTNPSRPHEGFIYRRPFNSDRLFRMDVRTRQWASVGSLSSLNLGSVTAMDIFPTMGPRGSLIFVQDNGRVARFDLASGTGTVLTPSLPSTGTYPISSYVAAIDAVIVGGGFGVGATTRLTKLDGAGTFAPISSTLPAGVPGIGPNSVFTLLLPDPNGAAQAYLIDSLTTGKVYRLELATGAWSEFGPVPASLMGRSHLTGAPIPGTGSFLFFLGRGRANSTLNLSQIFLFRVR